MLTLKQQRVIDADMAVRLCHWVLDHPNLQDALIKERVKAQRAKAIAEFYASGEKIVAVQKAMKCDYRAIKTSCEKHGVAMRN